MRLVRYRVADTCRDEFLRSREENRRHRSSALQSGASAARRRSAFALAEVMLGVLIFSIGIIALGRTVSNCVNASALSADDARVREILANRMVEIETTPGQPDKSKEFKIDTGFGIVKLVQKTAPQEMKEDDGTELTGIIRVTLTANWIRGGTDQSKQIAFYVYRL
jgi:Tfp pilus assembly protein PilV